MKNIFLFKFIILLSICLCQPILAEPELPNELPVESFGDEQYLPQTTQVNINTADVEALSSTLSGIGASKAMAIVAYREQYGEFKSVDELTNVRGVGTKTLDENRHLLTLGSN